MALALDAHLSDHWSIRVLVVQGESIDNETFNTILRYIIPLSSNIPLSVLTQCDGDTPNELSPFLKWYKRVPGARISVTYISEKSSIQRQERVPPELSACHLYKKVHGFLYVERYPVDEKEQEARKTVDSIRNSLSSTYRDARFVHAIYVEDDTAGHEPQSKEPRCTCLGLGVWKVGVAHLPDYISSAVYASVRRLTTQLLVMAQQLMRRDTERRAAQAGATTSARESKNSVARGRKKIADLYLLVGQPLAALQLYHEITELARSANDTVCIAACYESEAAAVRLYSLLPIEGPPETTSPSLASEGSEWGNFASPVVTPREHSVSSQLPAEIERLSNDASKRWPLSLPLSIISGSPYFDEFFRSSNFPAMSNFTVNVGRDVIGGLSPRQAPGNGSSRSAVLLGVIMGRLRDAAGFYQKAGSSYTVLTVELLLRTARLLGSFASTLPCLETLSRLCDEGKSLQPKDFVALLVSAGSVAFAIGARRHFVLLLLYAAWNELKCSANVAALNYAFFVTPWCFLGDLLLPDRTESDAPYASGNIQFGALGTQSAEWTDSLVYQSFSHMRQTRETAYRAPALKGVQLCSLLEDMLYYRITQYGRASAEFLRDHLTRLRHNGSSSWIGRGTVVLWPGVQLGVLKTLLRIYMELRQFEAAVYVVYMTVCKCHPILSSSTQVDMFRLLQFCANQVTQGRVRFPLALTLLPAQSYTKPLLGRERRQPKAFRLHENSYSKSLTFMGGVSRGSCPPVPTLVSIRVDEHVLGEGGWTEDRRSTAVYRCVRPRTCLPEEPEEEHSSVMHYLSSSFSDLRKSLGSSVFLVSPWRQSRGACGGNTLPSELRKSPLDARESRLRNEHVWVVGEPHSLTVVVHNPLDISVSIDNCTALTVGAALETVPSKVVIPPSVGASSPCCFKITVIPRAAGSLQILGVEMDVAGALMPQVVLVNDPKVQEYFSSQCSSKDELFNSERTPVDTQRDVQGFSEECNVLRSFCCISVEVVGPIPCATHAFHVSYKPAQRERSYGELALTSSGLPCLELGCPALSHSILPVSRHESLIGRYDANYRPEGFHSDNRTTFEASVQAINREREKVCDGPAFFPFDLKAIPSISQYGTGSLRLYVSLTNTSITNSLTDLQLVILQSSCASVKGCIEGVVDLQRPEIIFSSQFQRDAACQLQTYGLPFQHTTNFLEFDSSTCFSNVVSLPLTADSGVWRSITDVKRGLTCLEIRQALRPRETAYIPLIMRFGTGMLEEAVIGVRYTDSHHTDHFRYMLIPICVPAHTAPPLFIDLEGFSFVQSEAFDARPVIIAALESGDFSNRVSACLSVLLKNDTAHTTHEAEAENQDRYMFDSNHGLLRLDLVNSTTRDLECFRQDATTETAASSSSTVCTALSTTRWYIPITQEDLQVSHIQSNALTQHTTTSAIPSDQLTRSASLPIIKEARQHPLVHTVSRILSRLRYRNTDGRLFPLTVQVVHLDRVPSTSYVSVEAGMALKTPTLRSLQFASSNVPTAVASPVVLSYTLENGLSGEMYCADENCLINVPLLCPIVIKITITRNPLYTSTAPDANPASCDPIAATVVTIPYESLRRQQVIARYRRSDCMENPIVDVQEDGLLWMGSLENSVSVEDSVTFPLTLMLTTSGLKQTVFFGCICHLSPTVTVWHNSPAIL